HVFEVQPRRRLVQDVEGTPRVALRELGRELDPLRFAPGQRRGRLTEVDIAEPYVVQELQFRPDARLGLEEVEGLAHREVEHVGDRLSFITHLERLTVVAPALADLARDIDVREEVHLDLHEAVTLARLAPAPLDVERKAARSIAAD